jgi:hypothetical protein
MTINEESTSETSASEIKLKPEELRALVLNIENSGALGRSNLYIDLLRYLCETHITGTVPKEVVIAIDVMGKDADFDVKNDSVVRVYMHKLRQKLETYYQRQGKDEQYKLVIPKGRYALLVIARQPGIDKKPEQSKSLEPRLPQKIAYLTGSLILFSVLLAANLIYRLNEPSHPPVELSDLTAITENPIWAPLLADDEPIMLVVGDFYIFGEHRPRGEPDRLVREYHINTPKDLERHVAVSNASNKPVNYYNLDLSYIPRATAFVLKDILPVLAAAGKSVTVRMSSNIKGADLKSQHILYIGYISAMGELQSFAFQASKFAIGSSFDELVHIESGESHTSEEFVSANNRDAFYDYGMLSSFPMLDGHQMMFISGTRDTGLMHMAQIVSERRYLQTITQSLSTSDQASRPLAFEALYRVIGYDGLNFDAKQIHVGELDYKRIWGGEMMEVLK